MKKFLFALAASLFLSSQAFAQEAPDALVQRVSSEMADVVRSDKAIQAGDVKRMIEVVTTKILPYFDFNRMTGLAVGREWRNASAEQKKQLAGEFQTLLVRTYANALGQYKNQTIAVKPLKLAASDTETTVRSEIRQPGTKAVQLDYDMAKEGDGWKVYDIYVAGVSLVTNYRDTFGQEIKAGGIDGLIKSLHAKNEQGLAKLSDAGKK